MKKILDLANNKEFEERLGYKVCTLMDLFDYFSSEREPYERLWKLLDAFDDGSFWDHVASVLPGYSIKPDTNWVNYIKESLVNSLYVGSYRGDVFCRKAKDNMTTVNINEFLEYIFNKARIGEVQRKAGERAALLNFGATEVGWRSDVIDGVSDELFHGEIEAKHIDNLSLFLDPETTDYKKGQALFIAEEITIAELLNEELFNKRIREFLKMRNNGEKDHNEFFSSLSNREYGKGYYGLRSRNPKDNTLRLLTCYYKYYDEDSEEYRLDKVWIIEDGFVLNVQTNLKPKQFPIFLLYASNPVKDPYGTPVTKKILNNVISVNLLDAIDSTMIYNSLRRPKVISRSSGIPEEDFAENGNDPDRLWVVNGDPNNVLKYIDQPDVNFNRIVMLKQRLEQNIMRVSHVDDTYNGNDTNSVQTTGGMDILNQRISMRDNSRISLLQDYVLDITEYIMLLYLQNGGKRPFPKYNRYGEMEDKVDLDFEQMSKDQMKFDFTCNITPNLPNNAQRRADIANQMMEKQMQYQFNPQLISAEEWLEMQDFPHKYKVLKRMRDERMRDDQQEVEADLVNYAGMVQQGMRPDSAVNQLAQERQYKRDNPTTKLGNVQQKQGGN